MGIWSTLFGIGKAKPSTLRPGRGWVVEVVGESQFQDSLAASYRRHGGDGHDLKVLAVLVPENGNSQDPAAVRVEIDDKVVGYLPREIAPDYRAALSEQRGSCGAKIVGGFEKEDGTMAFFGVKLNTKWPPTPA